MLRFCHITVAGRVPAVVVILTPPGNRSPICVSAEPVGTVTGVGGVMLTKFGSARGGGCCIPNG